MQMQDLGNSSSNKYKPINVTIRMLVIVNSRVYNDGKILNYNISMGC